MPLLAEFIVEFEGNHAFVPTSFLTGGQNRKAPKLES